MGDPVQEFVNRILLVYNKTGMLPDVFNYLSGSPENIIVDKDCNIKIVDMHMIFCAASKDSPKYINCIKYKAGDLRKNNGERGNKAYSDMIAALLYIQRELQKINK